MLSAGFPVDCRDGAGATALDIAKKYEHSDVQGVLIRAGAVDTEVVPTISESNSTNATVSTAAAARIAASAAGATDSVVSVCGTETGADKAAEISSVVGDFIDTEYSENGTTTAPAAVPIAAASVNNINNSQSSSPSSDAATAAVTVVGIDHDQNSEDVSSKKPSTTSKHGKFAVSVPTALTDATAAVAAKAEDFVAYGKKALQESKAASTKAIENTKSVTLSYGHKALDGGKAAVETSKAYTFKVFDSGRTVVSGVADKADENVKVVASWMKTHSVYLLAGAGVVIVTAGVALALSHRKR